MLSYQSPMLAGAGTPRYENETWSLEVFGCGWCHPSPLDSGLRRNDEFGGVNRSSRIGVRDMLSYQYVTMLPPAGCCPRKTCYRRPTPT